MRPNFEGILRILGYFDGLGKTLSLIGCHVRCLAGHETPIHEILGCSNNCRLVIDQHTA